MSVVIFLTIKKKAAWTELVDLTPPSLSFDVPEKGGFHIFFINSESREMPTSFFIVSLSPHSSLAQPLLPPGRQVFGLWLPFCIVGSDGTADALYCEPRIAILWLQWGGQMDTVWAPWPGIKSKVNWQIEESTKNTDWRRQSSSTSL